MNGAMRRRRRLKMGHETRARVGSDFAIRPSDEFVTIRHACLVAQRAVTEQENSGEATVCEQACEYAATEDGTGKPVV
jgi:hypothetical protein